MGSEIESLVRTQQRVAHAATLYTVGLDGVRTICLRWAGPFADTSELVDAVEDRALRQANTLGGVHAFQLELADEGGRVLGTEVFRVAAEVWKDGRPITSEPANEGGLLAQLMRFNEGIMRTHVQGSERTLGSALKLLEQANKRADFSEAKFLESLSVIHSVMTGERETQVAMVKAEARAVATKQIGNKIATLLPEVTAAFLSGNAGPSGPMHAAVLKVKNVFSSITEEQLKGILNLLSAEQQLGVFSLMRTLTEEHEKEKAAEKAAAACTETKTGAAAAIGAGGANGAKH